MTASSTNRALPDLANRLRSSLETLGDEPLRAHLSPLVDALENGDASELHAWSEVDLVPLVDPREATEVAIDNTRSLRRLDTVRAVMIFAPIAVTWLGIALAARAYGQVPTDAAKYQNISFIALWERGFDGHGGFSPTLFQIGIVDFCLIAGLIAVTAVGSWLRSRIELEAYQRATAVRLTLADVQRALVDHRLHGVTRFRRELASSAGQLRSLASDAADSGRVTRDALRDAVEVMERILAATEVQRQVIDGFGDRLGDLQISVERIADVQESAESAFARHVDKLESVALAASEASTQVSSTGSQLDHSVAALADSLARVEGILDRARESIELVAQGAAEERAAQARLVSSMEDASGRFTHVGQTASTLETTVGRVGGLIDQLEVVLASATGAFPSSLTAATEGLLAASDQLVQSSDAHQSMVSNVRATAASMEISLAQVREDLTALHELLERVRLTAGSSPASAIGADGSIGA